MWILVDPSGRSWWIQAVDLAGTRCWLIVDPARSQLWILVDFGYGSWWIQMVMVNPVGFRWWILVEFSYGYTR